MESGANVSSSCCDISLNICTKSQSHVLWLSRRGPWVSITKFLCRSKQDYCLNNIFKSKDQLWCRCSSVCGCVSTCVWCVNADTWLHYSADGDQCDLQVALFFFVFFFRTNTSSGVTRCIHCFNRDTNTLWWLNARACMLACLCAHVRACCEFIVS